MDVIALIDAPAEHYPLWDWVGDEVRLRLVLRAASQSAPPPAEHAMVHYYDAGPSVRDALACLCDERRPDRILSFGRRDVLRAAAARLMHGVLAGQSYTSAVAHYDKVTMRGLLREADLPVTPWAPLPAATDLYKFIARNGYPVLIKTRDGSRPARRLDHAGHTHEVTEQREAFAPPGVSLIAEAYQSAPRITIDALDDDGRMELYPVVRTMPHHGGHTRGGVILDRGDLTAARAREMLRNALDALPERDTAPVHAEFWDTPGGLVAHQIVARCPSLRARRLIEQRTGTDPAARYVHAAVGKHHTATSAAA